MRPVFSVVNGDVVRAHDVAAVVPSCVRIILYICVIMSFPVAES